jgi:poly-gamma-glutamate synthesis protein (capsule biosynthesis protein)
MLGRGVAVALGSAPAAELFSPGLLEAVREADLFVLNLECCVSSRGEPWPAPGKQFFFRAPPAAAEALARLGVHCVTLANNHALDFGAEALLDTFEHLTAAGIRWAGAGPDLERARAPAVLEARGLRLAVVAVTDHPHDFAAAAGRPGVAFADLRAGVPDWLRDVIAGACERADVVLLSPHWGPNLTPRPPDHVLAAAASLRTGATLVAGHSAHVFHGVEANVLYDLGDFVDDYSNRSPGIARTGRALRKVRTELAGVAGDVVWSLLHRRAGVTKETFLQRQRRRAGWLKRMLRARQLRPELGLLFLVTLEEGRLARLEAVPLKLDRCHTRLAEADEAEWVRRRFGAACRALGTSVAEERGRSVIVW